MQVKDASLQIKVLQKIFLHKWIYRTILSMEYSLYRTMGPFYMFTTD